MPPLSVTSFVLIVSSTCLCLLACSEGGSTGSNRSAGSSSGRSVTAGTNAVGGGGYATSGSSAYVAGSNLARARLEPVPVKNQRRSRAAGDLGSRAAVKLLVQAFDARRDGGPALALHGAVDDFPRGVQLLTRYE